MTVLLTRPAYYAYSSLQQSSITEPNHRYNYFAHVAFRQPHSNLSSSDSPRFIVIRVGLVSPVLRPHYAGEEHTNSFYIGLGLVIVMSTCIVRVSVCLSVSARIGYPTQ